MQIDFNFLVIFHFVVVVHGITTAILLWRSGKESPRFRYLSLLVLAMTGQTVDSFLISAGLYRDHHSLYFFPLFFSWSYGPLFYSCLKRRDQFSFSLLWPHLIPVSIQFLFFGLVFVQSLEFKTWFWFNVHSPITRYVDVYVGILLVFVYLYAALDEIKKTDPSLRKFILALCIFFGVTLIDPLINHLYLPALSPKFYLIQYIIPIFTFWLSLRVYLREQKTGRQRKVSPTQDPRYFEKITALMESQKRYLNPELSLPELAQELGLNTSLVSSAINQNSGLSFNDFVNQYRVEEAKRQIIQGAHQRLTFLGVGLDSGFNSKNTFNRAFKKFTGISPSEFAGSIDPESSKSRVKL